ncbi:Rv3235 family protein [Rhodococcus erythropolis]|uniref:Rv3235 family protein n=1 Tax=Rhodococcus erythropolis TaxID=1833 RepID=UPI001E4979F7|nr:MULTISPECIES: Rv3235 family protein [Rhodococcus erythropolis group]MCD2103941.1 Rv3235 family protein [Rhodococcus qingshengii]MCZ4522994.1 Rv3235 family protein [Rhodococcus erythropolis]
MLLTIARGAKVRIGQLGRTIIRGDVMEQDCKIVLEPAPQFEPHAHTVVLSRPQCRPDRTQCRTDRMLRRPRKTPHNGTSAHTTPDPNAAGADIFWNRSLRLVLETVDRRRNPRQLKGVLTPTVLEVVARLYTSDSAARKMGGAAVHRTHVQAVSESAAEVCATYTRGTQTFAVAGRIDRADGTGWTVTALHMV